MAQFNPSFWEIQTDSGYLESVPAERALWFETEEDRQRRYAVQEFYQRVMPVVAEWIDSKLTRRQREVVRLYFLCGKTQEDIGVILDLSQSTVSRHLFGTFRDGKKVGGAVRKLRKLIDKSDSTAVNEALGRLQTRLAQTA